MKTIILELPEDTALWPQWLESRLVGLDLYDLVIGLKAIGDASAPESLLDICGTELPQLLKSGLKVLSTSQIRSLLNNPELLLELQERILSDGGAYWDSIQATGEVKQLQNRNLARVLEAVQKEQANVAVDPTRNHPKTTNEARPRNKFKSYLPVLALAAAVLIAVGVWPPSSSDGGGWGFDKSGLLTAQLSGRAYLNSLSEAAGAFSKKSPTSKESAIQRLTEFRAGCKKLIAAPNRQLENVADREWLVTKCKSWLEKIEGHIVDLEANKKDWEDVMVEANETVERMQQVLREKALELT